VNLSNFDILNLERDIYRESLYDFVKGGWHVLNPSIELTPGWHLEAVCKHLEAVTEGHINRLVINIPPGFMKSLLVSVFWPAWEWGARGLPSLSYLSTSHAQDLALRDNRRMRDLIDSDWYQERWPLKFSKDQNAKGEFQNVHRGTRFATSLSGLTGKRGDRVIFDDPISVTKADSPAEREKVNRIFRESLTTRVNHPEKSAIVMIMQRVHENDVTAIALENDYDHLCLPMEFEPERKCYTSIGFEDPRTEEGELLFPDYYSQETLDKQKRDMTEYAVAAQFQQTPIARGGGAIKLEWFNFYREKPQQFNRIVHSWDTAIKSSGTSDYSVCTVWGETDKGSYLLDMYRGKVEFPELLIQFKAMCAKHPAHSILIEDKASGQQLLQVVRREMAQPVIGVKVGGQGKLERAFAATDYIASGNIYLNENAEYLNELLHECEAFPGGRHDDIVDSITQYINRKLESHLEMPSISFL